MPVQMEMQPAVIVWDFNNAPVATKHIPGFVKKVREMANQDGGRVFERAFIAFGDASLMGMSAARTISDTRGVDLMHIGQAGQVTVNEKIREKLNQFDIDYRKQPGIIALISDDQGFVDMLSTMSRGGWRVVLIHPAPFAKRDLLDWVDHHCTVDQLLQGESSDKQKKRLSDVTSFLLISGLNPKAAKASLPCELILARLNVMIEELDGSVHYYNSSTDEALVSFHPLRKDAKNGTASAIARRCRTLFGADVAAVAVRDPRAELQRMRFIVDEKHQRLVDDAPAGTQIGPYRPYPEAHFYDVMHPDELRFSSTSGVSSNSSQQQHAHMTASGLFIPPGIPPPLPIFHHLPAPVIRPVNELQQHHQQQQQQHPMVNPYGMEHTFPCLVSAGEITAYHHNRNGTNTTVVHINRTDHSGDSARHSSMDSLDDMLTPRPPPVPMVHTHNTPSRNTTPNTTIRTFTRTPPLPHKPPQQHDDEYCASGGDEEDDGQPQSFQRRVVSRMQLSTIPENNSTEDVNLKAATTVAGCSDLSTGDQLDKPKRTSPPPGFTETIKEKESKEATIEQETEKEEFDFARVLKIGSTKPKQAEEEFPPLPTPKPPVAKFAAPPVVQKKSVELENQHRQQNTYDPHRTIVLRKDHPVRNGTGTNSNSSTSTTTRTIARTQGSRYNATPSFIKPSQQCAHWEDPKHLRHNCTFWHPRELCRYYPRCFYTADQCGFGHPFCGQFCNCQDGKRDSQQNHRKPLDNNGEEDRRKSFPVGNKTDTNNNDHVKPASSATASES